MFLLSFNAVNLQFSPDYKDLRREAREADRTRKLPQVGAKRGRSSTLRSFSTTKSIADFTVEVALVVPFLSAAERG